MADSATVWEIPLPRILDAFIKFGRLASTPCVIKLMPSIAGFIVACYPFMGGYEFLERFYQKYVRGF